MEYVAVPPFSVTVDPTALPSTLNCAVPVGVKPPLVCATVAVIVTDWPKDDGFKDEPSVVVVSTVPPVPVPLS